MTTNHTFDVDPGNAAQLRDWDGEHGDYWAQHADLYDRSLAGYHPDLLAAARLEPGERVLDVGCGSGRLAIDLVGAAEGASALGVDLSAEQLAVAARRGAGLPVQFLQADAQVHPFDPAAHDVVASRTGTMFFSDAAAAFGNLAAAARPGGRLAILVWQGLAENEWLREIFGVLRLGRDLPAPAPGAPGPFAQSDPASVSPLLRSAGWTDVAFEALQRPIWLGPDAERGVQWQLGQSAWLLRDVGESGRAAAAAGLHALFAAHQTPDGVHLGSAAWLVTARRAA